MNCGCCMDQRRMDKFPQVDELSTHHSDGRDKMIQLIGRNRLFGMTGRSIELDIDGGCARKRIMSNTWYLHTITSSTHSHWCLEYFSTNKLTVCCSLVGAHLLRMNLGSGTIKLRNLHTIAYIISVFCSNHSELFKGNKTPAELNGILSNKECLCFVTKTCLFLL